MGHPEFRTDSRWLLNLDGLLSCEKWFYNLLETYRSPQLTLNLNLESLYMYTLLSVWQQFQ